MWVTPIDQLEAEIRGRGMFLLVEDGRLRFYGFNIPAINRAKDSLKGRSAEMAKFLIARARARGEIL